MVKKKLTASSDEATASRKDKRKLVEIEHPCLSIRQQCDLLGLNRSSYYYQAATESELNLELMELIDKQYLKTPFYGYRKLVLSVAEGMTAYVRGLEYAVNRKRVSRLMNLMGIEAVGPKPGTGQPGKGHKIYPYLLRGVKITRSNQVWSADITVRLSSRRSLHPNVARIYVSGCRFGLA